MIRATTFNGKRVAVFGLGGSGLATVRSLLAGGAEVAAWDDNEKSRDAAAEAGLPLVDLRSVDWSGMSALVLAPGVPLTHPEPHWTVKAATAAGVEVIGDIEIFCRERRATAPGSPFIAITGTNGKSTTTALIAHILKSAGYDVQMGGNIGVPILSLEPPINSSSPPPIHVIEMSSFQIDLTPSLAPSVGILLNVSPDHLDRHGPADDAALALENYAGIKERLVIAAEVAAVGVDDEHSLAILKRRAAIGPVAPFSVRQPMRPGYCLHDGWLICSDVTGLAVKLAVPSGIATLRGAHNTQNALAAIAAVRELHNLRGWSSKIDWQAALASYPGLPHRMEEVGRAGRTLFINDSKATNADSTEKALATWEQGIFWILGGKAKEGGITPLASYFPRIAKAYLIGAASGDFAATLEGKVPCERSGTLEIALAHAAADAAASGLAEPVVLLSPACASYDQFRSFEHRGNVFRDLVRALPGVTR
ncbi:MAG: UDP-N-acetylmuramoyl-L-alanine--D-glutamate ligase [Proteobacteria bacterium]|nr:UDP-N-acetylmuramoyl-L-alanine--D-glutamate ligase [Pseudomonadota bacterium]